MGWRLPGLQPWGVWGVRSPAAAGDAAVPGGGCVAGCPPWVGGCRAPPDTSPESSVGPFGSAQPWFPLPRKHLGAWSTQRVIAGVAVFFFSSF